MPPFLEREPQQHVDIFVNISSLLLFIIHVFFLEDLVHSCEEVSKKKMERRPGSFELFAVNFRYKVSLEPLFLFQNKYFQWFLIVAGKSRI